MTKNDVFDTSESKNWLKSVLTEQVATVTFTKKDGTERILKCTLNSNTIPTQFAPKEDSTRAKNDEVLAVFDVESQGWRSFRWDSVKRVEFSLEKSK